MLGTKPSSGEKTASSRNEIVMFGGSCYFTRQNGKYIRGSLGIQDIRYNIEGKRIRCLGHIVRRGKDHIIKKIREFKVR